MAKYKLGDIAPIKQGIVPDSDNYWLLNLDMVESNTGRIIDYICVPKREIGTSTVSFDKGNVLYSKLRPYLNKVVIPEKPGYATSEMLPLCPDANVLTREYLTYFLRSPRFVTYINEKTSGAKMPRANITDLKAVEVDCPSIDEQKRITKVFDEVTGIIKARQQQLQKLDELVKARFVELFARVKAEDALHNLCTFIDYRGKTPEKVESGLPFITAKNVKMHRMSFDTLEYISKETYDRVMTRGFPRIGDVVFTTEAPLGNVCRIPFIETDFYIGQRIITMQTERLEPAYLEYALSSGEFKRKIAEKSSGSTVTGIRSKLLEQLTIPVPPRELQEQFTAFVEQTDKSKVAVQKALDEAQLLFDSLMQKYFG